MINEPNCKAGVRFALTQIAVAVLGISVIGCNEPPCEVARATLPESPRMVSFVDGPTGTVPASLGGLDVAALLDTGFRQTVVGPSVPVSATIDVIVGDARVSPISPALLLATPLSAVIGTDVLEVLPLRIDVRNRQAAFLSSFATASSDAVSLQAHRAGCGQGGPLYEVAVSLNGAPRRLLLDTGADITFLRTADLPAAPRLTGPMVNSGFAGTFAATAAQVETLSVGGSSATKVVVLSAPEVDRELDRVAAEMGIPQLDGFLGWSFLREFVVALDGKDAAGERTLALSGQPDLSHVKREFIGLGLLTRRLGEGLRVEAFFSRSPGQDAGLLVGDVIEAVDGRPAATWPPPWAQPGEEVVLRVKRDAAELNVTATVADLLAP